MPILCFRKGDVMNLLESAGFSRSNPYYIVKQGKVIHFQIYIYMYLCMNYIVILDSTLQIFEMFT